LQWAKGWIGARWVASDPNGDSMTYTVEIRGETETEWKPLKQKLAEKYFSWDSTAFTDGDYRVRITASDAPSNPPADALTGQLVSEVFTIDNTPPRVSGLSATATSPRPSTRSMAAIGPWPPLERNSPIRWNSITPCRSTPPRANTPSPSAWKTITPIKRRIKWWCGNGTSDQGQLSPIQQ
jgi:hypothetical protein